MVQYGLKWSKMVQHSKMVKDAWNIGKNTWCKRMAWAPKARRPAEKPSSPFLWFNLFSVFFSFLSVQSIPYGQVDRLFQMSHGAVWGGVRSRSSLSPERRKNSWSLYFNPWHKCWITRVFLRPIAFRICITLICGKCIWKEKNHVKAKKSTYFWSKTVKFFLHTSLEATLSPPLWTPTIKFYT